MTIRLSEADLSAIKTRAAAEKSAPSALVRRWVDQALSDQPVEIINRLDSLDIALADIGRTGKLVAASSAEVLELLQGFIAALAAEMDEND